MRTRSLGALGAALFWSLASGPPGSAEPEISPTEGQSQAQQDQDFSECQTLAIQQTGGLVPNGSFEDAFSCDQSNSEILQVPSRWQLTEDPGAYSETDIRVRCDDNAHSGSRHLRIYGSGAGWGTFIELSDPIKVDTGRPYRLRNHYRMEEINGDPTGRFYLQARYHDANGDPIEHQVCNNEKTRNCQVNEDCGDGGLCKRYQPTERLNTHWNPRASTEWHRTERIIRPGTYLDADTGEPVAAESVVLRLFKNGTFDGTIAFDDLSLEPMNIAELGALPDGSFAYDIVPTGGEATAGFEPLYFEQEFSDVDGEGCGFAKSFEHRNQESSYPTAMLSQSVKQSTINCRVVPGVDYIVSLYVGGHWRTGGDTERHEITVTNAPRISEWGTCVGGGEKDGHSCREKDSERDIDDCACDGEPGCSDGICKEVDLREKVHFAHVEATLVTPDTLNNKGYAIYDEYIWPRRYRRHELMALSEGSLNPGELKITVNGYVSGLVLIPVTDDEVAQGGLDTLKTFEDDMRHEFVSRWANYVKPETLGYPVVKGNYQASGTDSQRGYVLFRRHWMEFVEFSSRPDPEDVITDPETSPLQITATPGEYEPVTFSIWPLEDMYNVTLKASDLVSDSGDTISSTAVRTWYLQQRPHRIKPATSFTLISGFLPDWNVRELYTDITQRAWLNIQVPETAAAGTYRGEIELAHDQTGNGVEGTTLPLEIEVLPFQLVRPERTHVMRNSPGDLGAIPGDRDDKLQQTAQAFQDLANHGFTPESYTWWKHQVLDENGNLRRDGDGDLTVDWSKSDLNETLGLLKSNQKDTLWLDAASILHAGIIDESSSWTRADTRSWLKALEQHFGPGEGGKGFTKIYLHTTAEESQYSDDRWLQFLEDVRESREDENSPHVYSTHTFNTEKGQWDALDWRLPDAEKRGTVDLPALGIFHGSANSPEDPSYLSPTEQIAMAKRSNAESFLLYRMPGRIGPGFYLWKAGATGSFTEFYSKFDGALNNDWDNRAKLNSLGQATAILNEAPGHSSVTFSNSGRMIGSWYWEEMREGVDDDAYMNTLEHWIATTANDTRPQVIKARADAIAALKKIENSIDLDDLGLSPDDPQTATHQQADPATESGNGSGYDEVVGACMEDRGYAVN